jgi:3-oxoacyl-[acyl-carrier protein] reductase
MTTGTATSAIVAGASGGIGRAVARRLADGPAEELVVTYNEREAVATDLVADLRGRGVDATALALDVTDPDSVTACFTAADDALSTVDAVVSTVGIVDPALIEETTESSWGRVLETNLTGSYRVAKAAAPRVRSTAGSLVFLSSIGGTAGTVDASYAASKAGLHGLVRALARELGPDGVRVNAVAPGPVDTAMNDTILEHLEATDYLGHEALGTHLPEYACPPAEVAETVAGLLASGFTQGQVLEVNGGMHL